MKKNLFICSLIFSLCICNTVFAERITFSAGSMTGRTDSSSTVKLSDNAFVLTDTMEINASEIELSGEDYRSIKAWGGVSGKNLESKMNFSCDSMEYDRETKIAVLRGNVNLDDLENDVNAKAQLIEYNQNTEIAVLQIDINLTQKDNLCSGTFAVYHKNEQLLEISGNAQVRQGNDTFRAQQIKFDMNTQNITLDGNVKGTVRVTKENEENQPEAETSDIVETTEQTGGQ